MFTKKTVRSGIVGAGFSAVFTLKVFAACTASTWICAVSKPLTRRRPRHMPANGDIAHFENLDALLDEVDLVH
jgi:hypothetical protein